MNARCRTPCPTRLATQALHALRAATVHTVVEVDRRHAVGATWGIDAAIAYINRASSIAWVNHPTGHDLAVVAPDGERFFYVQRPH